MSLHLRDIDSPKESHPFISTRHSHNDYDIKTSNMDSSDITDPNMDDSDNDISDTETSDVDSPDNQSPNYDSPNTDDDDSDFDDSDFYLSSDDSDDDDFDPSNYESATHYARIYEFCEAEGVDIEDLDGRYYIVDHESNGLESDGAEPDHSTTETFSTLAEWAAAEKLAVLYSYSLIPGEKPIVKWIFPVEYRKTPPPPTAIALFLTDLKYLLSWYFISHLIQSLVIMLQFGGILVILYIVVGCGVAVWKLGVLTWSTVCNGVSILIKGVGEFVN